MPSDYSPKNYYAAQSFSRKRQIINAQLDELHTMQLDMIDQAVDYSDLRDAQEIINYIRSLDDPNTSGNSTINNK